MVMKGEMCECVCVSEGEVASQQLIPTFFFVPVIPHPTPTGAAQATVPPPHIPPLFLR